MEITRKFTYELCSTQFVIQSYFIIYCQTSFLLRFGSFGCSTWTSYTVFESSWPADFDYLILNQFNDVASWHIGHSVKRTVEIGAVALWYQFLLEKIFIERKYSKSTILNYCCRKPANFTSLCHFSTT